MDLQGETTELLRRLVRIDTVNPPGGERPAQELLAGLLEGAGFEVALLGRTEERPNLVARLRGAADGPVLGLLSHVDTVLATPDEWRHDPWSGELEDGFVWGRGAVDMKNQTAAEVTAAVSLAREGWRPARGELLVVAVVDEETGGGEGAVWLTENHPDEVRCDFLLNEGAGAVLPVEGDHVHGVCVAEKGVLRFTLATSGVAAHASLPGLGDNALLKMVPLLEAMRDRRPRWDVTEPPRALLAALGVELDGDPGAALEALRARAPRVAELVEPMLAVTLAPTRIHASEKINVIPSRAELQVDCRIPPGMTPEEALERVHAVLGTGAYGLEVNESAVGNASPVDSPLMDAIRAWLAEVDPEARVVPTMLPAFTDSRTFRAAFPDCVAYGFFPQRHQSALETSSLMHAKDERIDVRDLGLAADCYRDVTRRLLG
jgi:acetylornithine deacetylase/succinyl-diaminopimelate desuccinylase-like protein